MGQYFTLAAPRRREVLGMPFQMTESLFEWHAEAIVYLIATPNTKPFQLAPTQPQSRPSAVENEKRVAHEPISGHASKRIKVSRSREQGEISGQGKVMSGVPFVTLPHEIHQMIFDHLEHIEDVVCFGLCNRYFWQLGRRALYDHYKSFLAPWAGEKIVCVGDYVDPGDFPPGLFSEEEEHEFVEMLVQSPGVWHGDEASVTFTFDCLAHCNKTRKIKFDLMDEFCHIYQQCSRRGHGDPTLDAALKSIVMTNLVFYSTEATWMLRNLTTREFIRADTIALEPEFIHGPFIDGIGFGQVLLSRINWSSSTSATIKNSGEIHRGVWAGHRFDITTVSQHEKQNKDADWKDVGEEVMKEVATIWRAIDGPDWRKLVSDRAWKAQAYDVSLGYPEWG